MKVKVKFFAAMADAAGAKERELTLPDGARLEAAWAALKSETERLGEFERFMLCAVNAEYATMEDTLRDGDCVAFFPPVSGG